MDQRVKAFIVISTISVIIYVIYLMTSNNENSFLEAVGGRSAANQKLMVVDQATGEISFVKKSLEGINKNFTDQDVIVTNALKNLLGDNMTNYGGYTKSGNDGVLAKMKAADESRRAQEDQKFSTKTELAANRKLDDERLASLEGSIDKKINNGAGIRIEQKDSKGKWRTLGTSDCNIGNGNEEHARWCDAQLNHTRIIRW